ncbi:MAG TPA: hypothetical protein VIX63_03760 [Vicinamibacterales bacterium]
MTSWFELSDEEDRSLAAFMSEVAALAAPLIIGDPRPIWWKAQLIRRWDAERRAQAPLDVMERVEIVAGLAAAAALLIWAVPTVGRVIAEPFLNLLG